MITFEQSERLVNVAVLGEFTLADYREFEDQVNHKISFEGRVNLLFDLRDMLDYTLDVAWEEIKFSRQHSRDFGRIAVVTSDQWMAWSAWLTNLFVEAEVRVFDDYDEARGWVAEEEGEETEAKSGG
ncbi:MAG: STAS/SEC14 domain-containing protein [Betaproteobacteria bacterium]|nr:STAS/SEC14 domain-containing protein [Betaproteobacteria bacterium]